MTVFTIGHSTRSLAAFEALLRASGIECLVDVRQFPRSRRHPQFDKESLEASLPEAGIAYRHVAALGGRRGPKAGGRSRNTLWREAGFRNFADYAESAPFRDALEGLAALARERRVAIMCAEAVWWRCHRRIIADYLLAAGLDVAHILGEGKIEPGRLTEGAAPQPDGTILYAGDQAELAV